MSKTLYNPSDAKLSFYPDLDFEVVSINLLSSAMERSTKMNIVFPDACRDASLAGNLSRCCRDGCGGADFDLPEDFRADMPLGKKVSD